MFRRQALISVAFLLAGTNVVTYAATRHLTTRTVLERAEARVEAALRSEDLYDTALRQDSTGAFRLAFPLAGGMYYWWNDSLLYHGLGLLFIATGALVPAVSRRKDAAP